MLNIRLIIYIYTILFDRIRWYSFLGTGRRESKGQLLLIVLSLALEPCTYSLSEFGYAKMLILNKVKNAAITLKKHPPFLYIVVFSSKIIIL